MGMQHRVGRATIEINFGFVLVIISVLCFGSHLKMNLYDFHRKEVIQRESSQRLYFFILTVLICEHIISAIFLLSTLSSQHIMYRILYSLRNYIIGIFFMEQMGLKHFHIIEA